MNASSWSKLSLAVALMVASVATSSLPVQAGPERESWETVRTDRVSAGGDGGVLEKGLFGRCGNWSAWTQTSTGCRSAFRCITRRQQATYFEHKRQRQCRRGIEVQTRTRTICGC